MGVEEALMLGGVLDFGRGEPGFLGWVEEVVERVLVDLWIARYLEIEAESTLIECDLIG